MSNYRQYTLWTVWARWDDKDPWFVHHWTTAYTRSASIKNYDLEFRKPGYYRRQRRRGFLKCVRVRIVPEDPSTLADRTAGGERSDEQDRKQNDDVPV